MRVKVTGWTAIGSEYKWRLEDKIHQREIEESRHQGKPEAWQREVECECEQRQHEGKHGETFNIMMIIGTPQMYISIVLDGLF